MGSSCTAALVSADVFPVLFCEDTAHFWQLFEFVDMNVSVPFGFVLVGFTFVFIMSAMCGMRKHVDQRVNLKFLVAQDLSPINCWRQLQGVYGEDCMSKESVRRWHKRFQEGDGLTPTMDLQRSG